MEIGKTSSSSKKEKRMWIKFNYTKTVCISRGIVVTFFTYGGQIYSNVVITDLCRILSTINYQYQFILTFWLRKKVVQEITFVFGIFLFIYYTQRQHITHHNFKDILSKFDTHAHTHTEPFNGPLVWDYPGVLVLEENIHPLTPILVARRPLSTSSIYYNP